MRLLNGRRIFSASDLMRFQSCRYATVLDLLALEGNAPDRVGDDAEAALLQKQGNAHERDYLSQLETKGEVRVIETKFATLDQAAEATVSALSDGKPYIFQGAFRSGAWGGYSDFLERVDTPSKLGAYSYEVVDTKLKRSPDPKHVLQLVLYSDLLAEIQGVEPKFAHLQLGDGKRASIRIDEVSAYARRVRQRFEAFVAAPEEIRPEPVSMCGLCGWREHCSERWEREDSLTLVAGINRGQRTKLEAAGITALGALAANNDRVPKLADTTREKLQTQARLQAGRRAGGPPSFELRDAVPGKGFDLLPEPREGDVFYDIEGDPYFEGGLEYLHGFWFFEAGEWRFKAIWAHDHEEEAVATGAVIDFLTERMERYPEAHIYHYAPYEITALRRLTSRYRKGEAALDVLLRNGRFVDLYKVVRGALFASEPGYSIKNLEAFYMEARTGEVATAGGSVVAYEEWRETGNESLLEEIRAYNEDDVRSTKLLRDWLVREVRPAGHAWPKPEPSATTGPAGEIEDALADEANTAIEYCRPLAASMGDEVAQLVADLNLFHKREAKPAWWAIFDRLDAEDEELIDDLESLGALEAVSTNSVTERGGAERIYRVPEQESKLRTGDAPCIAPCVAPVSVSLREYDPVEGLAKVRGSKKVGALPDRLNLIPAKPISAKRLIEAVSAMTDKLLSEHSVAEPIRKLFMREAPRFHPERSGHILNGNLHDLPAAISSAIGSLDRSVLAIQGPPGTGKTYVSALSIIELIRTGRRVAVSSNSHKAIENLLIAICERAESEGLPVKVVHKVSQAAGESRDYRITRVESDDALEIDTADVVGGTAWHFARYDEPAFSHLFIDEAGQVSLANVMAMAACAENLVLVGDPMQLPQPVQGAHPGDSGRSCLEYYLDGQRVVSPELGIFLPTTRRMQEGVCGYISKIAYEGALQPDADANRQQLHDQSGSPLIGVRLVPVEHEGRSQSCPEEIDAIDHFIQRCIGAEFTDRDGQSRRLKLEDILIVAPYNAQVNALTAALPPGTRIGTVDKFQGQEAPVCLVSMATSSAEELPRDIEFLFSLNRINVAVSRAKVCARVFASPRLLDTPCRTVEQMKLVNALCALTLDTEPFPEASSKEIV